MFPLTRCGENSRQERWAILLQIYFSIRLPKISQYNVVWQSYCKNNKEGCHLFCPIVYLYHLINQRSGLVPKKTAVKFSQQFSQRIAMQKSLWNASLHHNIREARTQLQSHLRASIGLLSYELPCNIRYFTRFTSWMQFGVLTIYANEAKNI